MRRCERCGFDIQRGELYSVTPFTYLPQCGACTTAVQGPEYWAGKYSSVARDGLQVDWSERQHWATPVRVS